MPSSQDQTEPAPAKRRPPVATLILAVVALAEFGLLLASIPAPPPHAPVVAVPPPPVAVPPAPAAPAPPDSVPAPAAPPALPPLPEVELGKRAVHAIPEEPPGPNDRHVSEEVAHGPRELPSRPAQKQFSGLARVVGPTGLMVGDVRVELFGVKPPGPNDKCGFGVLVDCGAAARRALAQRLPPGGTIYCQVPLAHPGALAVEAICLDPNSADLGGYLVAEGLALADTSQSYDYVGAEGIARNARRGLWAGR